MRKLRDLILVSMFAALTTIGLVYLYISYNLYFGKNISFYFAFFYGFVVCIGGDLVLTVFAAYISVKILPLLKKGGYIN